MDQASRKRPILVWDLPTRLFHWLLVALMVAAFVTGQLGGDLIQWHGRLGLAIIGLLAFRLVWGFVGSTYARFASFIPRPATIVAYLRGRWRGLGHNPMGALSVYGLLTVVAIQAVTGLFANDDIAFQGPLAALVDGTTSQFLTSIHRLNVGLLLALVGLHLAAILFYTWVKRESLVPPMITGIKLVEDAQAEPAAGGGLVPFLVALLIALGVVSLAAGVLIEPPPPPPPAPEW
jgi:cytochrome b